MACHATKATMAAMNSQRAAASIVRVLITELSRHAG
jgi:hypothetical protein